MKKLNLITYYKLLKQGKENLLLIEFNDKIIVTNKKTGNTYQVSKSYWNSHKEKYDTSKITKIKKQPEEVNKTTSSPVKSTEELKDNAFNAHQEAWKEYSTLLKKVGDGITPEAQNKLHKLQQKSATYFLASQFSYKYNVGFTDQELQKFYNSVTQDREQHNILGFGVQGQDVLDNIVQLDPQYQKYFPKTYKFLRTKKQNESTSITPEYVPIDYAQERRDAIARTKGKSMPKEPGKLQDQFMEDKYVKAKATGYNLLGLDSFEDTADGTKFYAWSGEQGEKKLLFTVSPKDKDQAKYLKNVVRKNRKKSDVGSSVPKDPYSSDQEVDLVLNGTQAVKHVMLQALGDENRETFDDVFMKYEDEINDLIYKLMYTGQQNDIPTGLLYHDLGALVTKPGSYKKLASGKPTPQQYKQLQYLMQNIMNQLYA